MVGSRQTLEDPECPQEEAVLAECQKQKQICIQILVLSQGDAQLQCLHLLNGNDNSTHLVGLQWELKKYTCKDLTQCLALGKCSLNDGSYYWVYGNA